LRLMNKTHGLLEQPVANSFTHFYSYSSWLGGWSAV
jgi:hypothetical protein